jgi:hypothetical protein
MRPGPVREARKIPSPPKKHVANSLNSRDLKINSLCKHPYMAGMHPHRFPSGEIVGYNLAIQFDPSLARAPKPL